MNYAEKFYMNIGFLALAYGLSFAKWHVLSVFCATLALFLAIYFHSFQMLYRYRTLIFKSIVIQFLLLFFLGLHIALIELPLLVICNTCFAFLWSGSSGRFFRNAMRNWLLCYIVYFCIAYFLSEQALQFYFSATLFPRFSLQILLVSMFFPMLICDRYFRFQKIKWNSIVWYFRLKYSLGERENGTNHTVVYSGTRSL